MFISPYLWLDFNNKVSTAFRIKQINYYLNKPKARYCFQIVPL